MCLQKWTLCFYEYWIVSSVGHVSKLKESKYIKWGTCSNLQIGSFYLKLYWSGYTNDCVKRKILIWVHHLQNILSQGVFEPTQDRELLFLIPGGMSYELYHLKPNVVSIMLMYIWICTPGMSLDIWVFFTFSYFFHCKCFLHLWIKIISVKFRFKIWVFIGRWTKSTNLLIFMCMLQRHQQCLWHHHHLGLLIRKTYVSSAFWSTA